MSTFDGLIEEFPDIRVDFFRSLRQPRPALACFLSHIHSDHLAGLEHIKSPFVYCSPATRQMLLRLERFPVRFNYNAGILEKRTQTYKKIRTLLKPLPLDTPVTLELEPGRSIQVTLFDANHCPGSVMFLFEGGGKAALYTGDIRSEPWHVNALARNPCLIDYTSGMKTLDTIYLDTSFTEDYQLQTKAEGIRELLQKVSSYPDDTIFFVQAWTYGYEDVWVALSKFLKSKIHVDEYKLGVYQSLVAKNSNSNGYGPLLHLSPEAPNLVGFMCGNSYHEGCLTSNDTVRIHSCEKGTSCSTVQNSPVVWLQPIIAHLPNGQDVTEVGVGGGSLDLEQQVELDTFDEEVDVLLELVRSSVTLSDSLKQQILLSVEEIVASGRNISLDIHNEEMEKAPSGEALASMVQALAEKAKLGRGKTQGGAADQVSDKPAALPRKIRFPYSRHSAHPELCHLVQTFKPKDVWPCTENRLHWLRSGVTIKGLFGEHCSGTSFRYDELLHELGARIEKVREQRTRPSPSPSVEPIAKPTSSEGAERGIPETETVGDQPLDEGGLVDLSGFVSLLESDQSRKRDFDEFDSDERGPSEHDVGESQDSCPSQFTIQTRADAAKAVVNNITTSVWEEISLISTRGSHSVAEEELGEG